MLVANAKTNFMLSTNPENFEDGKCIRHQHHIQCACNSSTEKQDAGKAIQSIPEKHIKCNKRTVFISHNFLLCDIPPCFLADILKNMEIMRSPPLRGTSHPPSVFFPGLLSVVSVTLHSTLSPP